MKLSKKRLKSSLRQQLPKIFTLETELDSNPFWFRRCSRLQQVLWNLLLNAIKFTPKDGRIAVKLGRVNSYIEIIVTDTGKGISAEFLPYVFERLQQEDNSKTRRQGGLGLGLAITRHIVELHGGAIRATVRAKVETTFTVSLQVRVVGEKETSEITAGDSAIISPIFLMRPDSTD